jgi:hypothetical protein
MTITVCSCFRHDADYAKSFVESLRNWPADVKFRLYYHDGDLPDDVRSAAPSNVEFVRLETAAPGIVAFKQRFLFADGTLGKTQPYDFRKDGIKFAHKVFAIVAEARRLIQNPTEMPGHLIWLDADTVTHKQIDAATLKSWLPLADVVVLDRQNVVNYIESSYVAFNLGAQAAAELIADLDYQYSTGEIFGYSAWDDGFVLSRLLKLHTAHGLRVHNLTPNATTLDAFGVSPLAPFIRHFKGNAKSVFAGTSAAGPKIFADGPMPATPKSQPIRVVPQDCRPAPEIIDNIVKNTASLPEFIQRCRRHNDVALVVSGGPSWKRYLGEIADLTSPEVERRHRLIAVKHSLPGLLDAGLKPWACVLLDPRNIDGTSTHGVVRKELLKDFPSEMIFFVATMTDPSVVEYLKERGARMVGWHAYSNAAAQHKLPEGHFYITGGTSAAMRSVGIFHTVGFREFRLYGYDSSLEDMPAGWEKEIDEKKRPKYLPIKVGEDGVQHITTGELLAQAQDIEHLWQQMDVDIDLMMRSDGIAGDIAKKYPRLILPNYENLYGRA